MRSALEREGHWRMGPCNEYAIAVIAATVQESRNAFASWMCTARRTFIALAGRVLRTGADCSLATITQRSGHDDKAKMPSSAPVVKRGRAPDPTVQAPLTVDGTLP